jgi:heme/copper-type cytochrome/quinol oxidase subunit 2
MKFIYIRKQWIFILAFTLLLILTGWYLIQPITIFTTGQAEDSESQYTIHMVTGEFATKTEAGKEIEAYRWDPGTIVVPKDQEVSIRIYGVNGVEHPFYIEGTDYKGTVQKGKETVINVTFDQEGTYRLICLTHPTLEQNGPMIAYIVVD